MKRFPAGDGAWVSGGKPQWRWLWFIPGRHGRLFRVHPQTGLLQYAGSLSGEVGDWRTEESILGDVQWWNPKSD